MLLKIGVAEERLDESPLRVCLRGKTQMQHSRVMQKSAVLTTQAAQKPTEFLVKHVLEMTSKGRDHPPPIEAFRSIHMSLYNMSFQFHVHGTLLLQCALAPIQR